MRRVHILNQYVWPDAAPTAIYAEQLAGRLATSGREVFLVGGKGKYRPMARPQPLVALVLLDHFCGRRGSFVQTLQEYGDVNAKFRTYIRAQVQADDVVVVTSAPPNTVWLAAEIRSRKAIPIYWLQDYYPELIRGVWEYPRVVRKLARHVWDRALSKWEVVVKIGGNLGGPDVNSVIIRNWPTLQFGKEKSSHLANTAIYSGNLGFGHDIDLFINKCKELRDRGIAIRIHADGPGVRRLPAWLQPLPLLNDSARLKEILWESEFHLVAAHPKIQEAVFPSKIWNSMAAGGRIIGSGFEGKMKLELERTLAANYARHLAQWESLLAGLS